MNHSSASSLCDKGHSEDQYTQHSFFVLAAQPVHGHLPPFKLSYVGERKKRKLLFKGKMKKKKSSPSVVDDYLPDLSTLSQNLC